jgi:membrane-associated phospholipid phosphatase
LAFLVAAWQPGLGHAQDGSTLWLPQYRRVTLVDALVAAGGGLLYLGDMVLLPRRDSALWQGGVLWDDVVRDAVVFDTRADREQAAQVSDYLFAGSVVHNLLFDNLIVALALHGEPDTALQMSVMNLEAYAVAGALTGLIKTAAGRARPYASECEGDRGYTDLCGTETTYRAFFSAHATTTAVGAGLLCAHHLHMPLYGSRALDWGTCGLGVMLTIATGTLRMTSDRHWSTDVMTGHLVGFSAGYLIPTLLHYRWNDGEDAGPQARTRSVLALPFVTDRGAGGQLVGFF